MNIVIDVRSQGPIEIFIDSHHKRLYSDKKYTFDNVAEKTEIKIKQYHIKHKWFMFPLYLFESIFYIISRFFDELSCAEFICPYLHECSFIIEGSKNVMISIDSYNSHIEKDGSFTDGCIKVDTNEKILNMKLTKYENYNSFDEAIFQLYYTFSLPIIALAFILIFLLFRTNSTSLVGWIFSLFILVFSISLSYMKINFETKKILEIKERVKSTIEKNID